jgi:hypothetical protein
MEKKVGLRKEIHTLNLAIFQPELTIECEDCGYELPMLKSAIEDLPDAVICSTCQAAAWWAWRQKKKKTGWHVVFQGQDVAQIPKLNHGSCLKLETEQIYAVRTAAFAGRQIGRRLIIERTDILDTRLPCLADYVEQCRERT